MSRSLFPIRFALALFLSVAVAAQAAVVQSVKGFSLTEIGDHLYDAHENPARRTEAQAIVDRLYEMGVRHINLSPRATMRDPRQSFVVPMTPPPAQEDERARYGRLIRYIHAKGMTVGIRPTFFVIDELGNTPLIETLPGGTTKVWWHGNVQPADPAAWFASFTAYLEQYMAIAVTERAEEFTIGAELRSLTVGIGAAWPEAPYGQPALMLQLLSRAKAVLPPTCRIMYDINYTDEAVMTGAGIEYGDELIDWRRVLADEATPADPAALQRWRDRVAFWKGLDAVGVDMYRSLASADEALPFAYAELVARLRRNSDAFAAQLDDAFRRIALATGVSHDVILKELGYRSVERGFIDPFNYAGPGIVNIEHQAAAYEAVMASFTTGRSWFKGVVFWDASVDIGRHGPVDPGFSPIGKALSEQVLRHWFGRF